MMDLLEIPLIQSRFQDVNQIPTNRLQLEMLVTIYLTAALAYLTYGLRMYSRVTLRQIGLGKHDGADLNYDGFFCHGADHFTILQRTG